MRLPSLQARCSVFWRHLEPTQYTRDEGCLSKAAATGGGGLGTDDTHHPNGSGGAQFVCCSDCVPVHPNSSYTTACPGDTQTITEKI